MDKELNADAQSFYDAASSVCDIDIFSDLDRETAGMIWRAFKDVLEGQGEDVSEALGAGYRYRDYAGQGEG